MDATKRSQHVRRHRLGRGARLACTAGLACALVLGGAPAAALGETAETAAQLASLTSEVSSATSAYADSMSRVRDLEDQVNALADEILALEQETLPATRERASAAVTTMYKMNNGSANILAALLTTDSFADLLDFAKYLGVIKDTYLSDLESLKEVRDQLNDKLAAVSAAKDEAESAEASAAASLAQAKAAQQKMREQAASEDAAEAAAAQKAAEEAAATVAAVEATHAQNASAGTSTAISGTSSAATSGSSTTSGSAGSGSTSSSSSSSSSGSSSSGTSSSSGSTSSSGWLTGTASYYGIGDGFMGGTTASGETVTETSMGIAMLNVPFGTKVEISYGGRSVIAYVNDRGPYTAGRVIDMQPAVARALGFLSVGVGTVSYRFL
ncbi:RlpA-like double-psi beta-barrel domain-containing protein [Collinsella vaginalis]|uniref:RlpA-like double-psi beta-barrel domain-containing protein n=2 Tax=Collinsella vaginalis TaxID=1870987 RepID=UPI000A26F78C|nr:RlpA-like double-psi beta-barrel domain-containing protein [Collinsella vaginalis]